MITGVYKIQSISNPTLCYIGSSVDIQQRWRGHLSSLSKNEHYNHKLQKHYNKYGRIDLEFSIIVCCDKESLIATEQFYIDSFNLGFNLYKKAGSPLGCRRSNEWKVKKKELMLGNQYALGIRRSEETKRKMSESHKGKKPMLGRKLSEEWKKNIGNSHRGMKYYKEHRIGRENKIHYYDGNHSKASLNYVACGLQISERSFTDKIENVTCKNCLRIINSNNKL